MAIVPKEWLCESANGSEWMCIWPHFFKTNWELTKAVRLRTDLSQRREECSLCKINIKYKTNNYDKAVTRLKDLEKQIDFSSSQSSAGETESRRKIYKNKKYEDYFVSSCDENDLPPIPRIAKMKKNPNVASSSCTTHNTLTPALDELTVGIPGVLDETLTPEPQLEREPVLTFQQLSENVMKTQALVEKTFRSVKLMANELKCLSLAVRSISLQNSNEQVSGESELLKPLPAKSENDLRRFNMALAVEKIFVEVCTSLVVIGGKDGSDCVRRLLFRIVSHELSLKLNWTGRNNKSPFKVYENIIKLITGVIRKQPLLADFSQTEVENSIKIWLRTAMDREGGREKRRNRNE